VSLHTKNIVQWEILADTGGLAALKDADGMIRDMLTACDINHDGQISYDEFVQFCNETEKELWTLFQSIDRDHNGNLDKSELSQAFEKAGVAVSNARLDRFFGYIDKNHDGTIDFPEWRGKLPIHISKAGFRRNFSWLRDESSWWITD
jgi:solute carrier family 25 phosphate transporter 23/24/25/41